MEMIIAAIAVFFILIKFLDGKKSPHTKKTQGNEKDQIRYFTADQTFKLRNGRHPDLKDVNDFVEFQRLFNSAGTEPQQRQRQQQQPNNNNGFQQPQGRYYTQ